MRHLLTVMLTYVTPLQAMKQQKHEPHKKGPTVVTTSSSSFTAHIKQPLNTHSSTTSSSSSSLASVALPDYDVLMCGGTLGIMVALALQQQGFRVAVVEKRVVQGRTQEWNTSRHECQVSPRHRDYVVLNCLIRTIATSTAAAHAIKCVQCLLCCTSVAYVHVSGPTASWRLKLSIGHAVWRQQGMSSLVASKAMRAAWRSSTHATCVHHTLSACGGS